MATHNYRIEGGAGIIPRVPLHQFEAMLLHEEKPHWHVTELPETNSVTSEKPQDVEDYKGC